MSHTTPDDPALKHAMEATGLPMTHAPVSEDGPAVTDAGRILLIVVASIVVFAAIVQLFVM